MKCLFNLLLNFILCANLLAQINIGNNSVNNDVVIDANSTNQGVLLSYVELESITSPSPLISHTEGMWVYNKASAGVAPNNVYPGMYYNDGQKWIRIDGAGPKIGDIKLSFEGIDHNGWYLIDGRNLSSLSTTARNQALSLGFSTALPNAENRFLKGGNGTTSTYTGFGGSTNFSIQQANLPAVTYSGTTSEAGLHFHTYFDRGGQMWHGSTGTAVTGLSNIEEVTRSTELGGSHTHSFNMPLGGSDTPIDFVPRHVVMRMFIYLGF